MKRLLLAALLTLVLPSLGCVGYHRGYDSSYSSPGCYSCSRTREHHEDGHHRDRDRGGHHHHHDDDHDDHHHRRH